MGFKFGNWVVVWMRYIVVVSCSIGVIVGIDYNV